MPITTTSVPELVTVTVWPALVVVIGTWPNASEVGATPMLPPGVPVPERFTVLGEPVEPPPENGIESRRPGAAPLTVGVNATFTVQVSPPAWTTLPEQVSAVMLYGPEGSETVPMVASALPLLVTVMVCAALVVPTAWGPNGIVPGATPITACVPVPVSATVACVVSAPVYLIVSVSGSVPIAVGLNATVIVHLAAAPLVASVTPAQPFVSW